MIMAPMKHWTPTMNLRFKMKQLPEQSHSGGFVTYKTANILQQEWKCTDGSAEWRDVPLELAP